MAQTAQDVLNAINGVTFEAGALGTTYLAAGLNPAHGRTDVDTAVTNASTGNISVAYVANVSNSSVKVSSISYSFNSGDATHFPTFGTITLSGGGIGGYNIRTYYVHGFSSNGLLLSGSSSLSLDNVNGISRGAKGDFFEILSFHNMGAGPSSPAFPTSFSLTGANGSRGSRPSYYYLTYSGQGSYTDKIGIAHTIKYSKYVNYGYNELKAQLFL